MTVFIQRGDAHLTERQAIARGRDLFKSEWLDYQREAGLMTGAQSYLEWSNQWLNDNAVNEANNVFNRQLEAYRQAVARLAQYRAEDGRPAVFERVETGETDPETGEPISELIEVLPAVEPLPEVVPVEILNHETGEVAATVDQYNPAIIADENERSAAQAVIDATPQEVKDFDHAA